MNARILLIEDDPDMARLLRGCLEDANYSVVHASDGQVGLDQALNDTFSIVITDLSLPKVGGMDICRKLRETKPAQPIIIVTSRHGETDKVLGLEFGADDYVTKPFSAPELIARVRSVLRRSTAREELVEKELLFGELRIDAAKRLVSVAGKFADLTATEFDLLLFLATHPGRPFSRDELMEQIWGYQTSTFDGTVTTHLSRLRSKLEKNPAKPQYICTVRGVGYKFLDR